METKTKHTTGNTLASLKVYNATPCDFLGRLTQFDVFPLPIGTRLLHTEHLRGMVPYMNVEDSPRVTVVIDAETDEARAGMWTVALSLNDLEDWLATPPTA